MNLNKVIRNKISKYKPKNGLDHIATFFISLSSIKHGNVTGHVERVALLSEAVAKKLKLDTKLAFFAGLMHDVGKIVLPFNLFDGHNITKKEYEEVKKHAIYGSEMLSNTYLFTSLCCGLHHAVYQNGYGLTLNDFPENVNVNILKKTLTISTIVSICDFIEAFTHRNTKLHSSSGLIPKNLRQLLYEKYPYDTYKVDIALYEYPKIKYW
jgi:putative nucleotidyltransferase with HDIG domain